MPIYVYWGEDDFAMEKAVVTLRDRILDPLALTTLPLLPIIPMPSFKP
jgi:DNA polymerase III delta subunit